MQPQRHQSMEVCKIDTRKSFVISWCGFKKTFIRNELKGKTKSMEEEPHLSRAVLKHPTKVCLSLG
jgi:hypothetical protein